jgi:hypothetical protein
MLALHHNGEAKKQLVAVTNSTHSNCWILPLKNHYQIVEGELLAAKGQ